MSRLAKKNGSGTRGARSLTDPPQVRALKGTGGSPLRGVIYFREWKVQFQNANQLLKSRKFAWQCTITGMHGQRCANNCRRETSLPKFRDFHVRLVSAVSWWCIFRKCFATQRGKRRQVSFPLAFDRRSR